MNEKLAPALYEALKALVDFDEPVRGWRWGYTTYSVELIELGLVRRDVSGDYYLPTPQGEALIRASLATATPAPEPVTAAPVADSTVDVQPLTVEAVESALGDPVTDYSALEQSAHGSSALVETLNQVIAELRMVGVEPFHMKELRTQIADFIEGRTYDHMKALRIRAELAHAHVLMDGDDGKAFWNGTAPDISVSIAALRRENEALKVQIAMASGFARGVTQFLKDNHNWDGWENHVVTMSHKDLLHVLDILSEVDKALSTEEGA